MSWFSRKAPDSEVLAHLSAEVSRLGSALRVLEGEQQLMHDQVRKWMRRAVAAERAVERAEPEGPRAEVGPVAPAVLTGVRARRLARMSRGDPMEEANGVHS